MGHFDSTISGPFSPTAVTSQSKEVSAGNITFYTIEKLRSGRRSTGSSVVDVFGSQTQLNGTTRLNSLEEVVASSDEGGEIFTFNDVLSRDEEDPSTRAARKMDWETFMAGLSSRDQAIIQFLIEGTKASAMAGNQSTRISYALVLVWHLDGLDHLNVTAEDQNASEDRWSTKKTQRNLVPSLRTFPKGAVTTAGCGDQEDAPPRPLARIASP
jgi:hypothetical protein